MPELCLVNKECWQPLIYELWKNLMQCVPKWNVEEYHHDPIFNANNMFVVVKASTLKKHIL